MSLEHGPPTYMILRREDALRDGLECLLVGRTTVGLSVVNGPTFEEIDQKKILKPLQKLQRYQVVRACS
jgi:hypothetical protein